MLINNNYRKELLFLTNKFTYLSIFTTEDTLFLDENVYFDKWVVKALVMTIGELDFDSLEFRYTDNKIVPINTYSFVRSFINS